MSSPIREIPPNLLAPGYWRRKWGGCEPESRPTQTPDFTDCATRFDRGRGAYSTSTLSSEPVIPEFCTRRAKRLRSKESIGYMAGSCDQEEPVPRSVVDKSPLHSERVWLH
jgi:hypothetical protein